MPAILQRSWSSQAAPRQSRVQKHRPLSSSPWALGIPGKMEMRWFPPSQLHHYPLKTLLDQGASSWCQEKGMALVGVFQNPIWSLLGRAAGKPYKTPGKGVLSSWSTERTFPSARSDLCWPAGWSLADSMGESAARPSRACDLGGAVSLLFRSSCRNFLEVPNPAPGLLACSCKPPYIIFFSKNTPKQLKESLLPPASPGPSPGPGEREGRRGGGPLLY